MSFTVDYTTNIGKVRALINDVDSANPGMQDEQLQVFLDLENADIVLAAVDALLAMAMRFARLKKVKIMDIELDGTLVAKDLRATAKQLRDDYFDDPNFDVAKQLNTSFAIRQDVINQLEQENPQDWI